MDQDHQYQKFKNKYLFIPLRQLHDPTCPPLLNGCANYNHTVYSINTGDEESGISLDTLQKTFYNTFGRSVKRIRSNNNDNEKDEMKRKEENLTMPTQPMVNFEDTAWTNLNNLLLLYEAGKEVTLFIIIYFLLFF